MKKIMIAAAIVCAAAFSQAATCYWNVQTYGTQKYYQAGGSATYSGNVYLFMVNGTTLTQQTILTALLGGSDVASLGATKVLSASGGAIASTSFTTESTSGQTYQFFTVIDNGDTVWIGKTYGLGASESTSGTNIALKDQTASKKAALTSKTISGTAGAWYSVPEPTSGLLMLLGMAGLALRRRRA